MNSAIGQRNDQKLVITHLRDNFYIYTTYNLYNGNKVPSNGLYILTSKGTVLIDSPWDTTQFQPLLDSIRIRHHQHVVMCIATHFHDDRTAGLEFYRKQGIQTYTTIKTDQYSKERGKKRAEFLISEDTVFNVGEQSFQTYFPGEGHTRDNIVIWFNKQRILYGGCLIKSTEDDNLGYLGDANTNEYANSIRNIIRKYKRQKYVIPGHGDWRNKRSLKHTLAMARKFKHQDI